MCSSRTAIRVALLIQNNPILFRKSSLELAELKHSTPVERSVIKWYQKVLVRVFSGLK